MMMPPLPVAAFVVIQAEFFFELVNKELDEWKAVRAANLPQSPARPIL
jgi:hypothetical protein